VKSSMIRAIPLAVIALLVFSQVGEAWKCNSLEVVSVNGPEVTVTYDYNADDEEKVELDWGDGNVESLPSKKNSGTASYSYESGGTFDIELRVFNDDGDDFRSCNVQVTIEGLPPSGGQRSREEEEKGPSCVEIDVKTDVQGEQNPGFSTPVRFWVNSLGVRYREVDLLRNFPDMIGEVQSQSIDAPTGCWVYFSFVMSGEENADLWIVDSLGFTLEQLSNTPYRSETDVDSRKNGLLLFSAEGILYQVNPAFLNIVQVGFGTNPNEAPDGRDFAFVYEQAVGVSSQENGMLALPLDASNVAWVPDGTGLFHVMGDEISLYHFETGTSVPMYDGVNIAPDPRFYPEAHIIERDGQLVWHWLDESRGENQLTNDEFVHSQPDWWVAQQIRMPVNMTAFTAFTAAEAAKVVSVEVAPSEDEPTCADFLPYQGIVINFGENGSVEICANTPGLVQLGFGGEVLDLVDEGNGLYRLEFEDPTGGNLLLWGDEVGVRYRDGGNEVVKYFGGLPEAGT